MAHPSSICVEYGCDALIQILVSASQEEVALLNEIEDVRLPSIYPLFGSPLSDEASHDVVLDHESETLEEGGCRRDVELPVVHINIHSLGNINDEDGSFCDVRQPSHVVHDSSDRRGRDLEEIVSLKVLGGIEIVLWLSSKETPNIRY